jgi:hypothetical protein
MAEVITFNCSGCSKPYRVAISYAGRDFACKTCGARLSVPQADELADTKVELGSGGQVMRGTTTSGRQVAADPTRVFTRQRETSARMAAVAPHDESRQSGKGPLIAVIAVVVVLAVGGVGVAAALGVFAGNDTAAGQVTQTNSSNSQPKEESERSHIFKQLDVPGQSAADFVKLLKRAEDAELEAADITTISRATVSAMLAESGAGFSDAELMSFASRMHGLNVPVDAESLYALIVERGRASSSKSAEYKQAHEKLGHSWVDIGPQIEGAAQLRDSGVVEGMDKLRTELLEMEKRADQGWLIAADKQRFDEVVKLLEAGRAEYDKIARLEPFRIKAADAQRRFKLEKASGLGHWVMLTREPFVFFVQLQGGEDLAGAEKRLESALAAAEQFPAFYRDQLVAALELKRMLPNGLSEAERAEAPFVIKLFRDPSYLKPHLTELGVKMDVTLTTAFTEPGTGHLSMSYKDHDDSIGTFARALINLVMYNYHPHAPTTRAEDDKFQAYSCSILNDYFHSAITAYTGLDQSGGEFTYDFFRSDGRPARTLKRWAEPFEKEANGSFVALGGQVLGVKDMVGAPDRDALLATTKTNLTELPGWTEGDLLAATTHAVLGRISGQYVGGLYQFLYHWAPDGTPKYRDRFVKFVRMDLAGEVDKDDPLPAFNKAFGLDEAGWKQIEADYTAYQS